MYGGCFELLEWECIVVVGEVSGLFVDCYYCDLGKKVMCYCWFLFLIIFFKILINVIKYSVGKFNFLFIFFRVREGLFVFI